MTTSVQRNIIQQPKTEIELSSVESDRLIKNKLSPIIKGVVAGVVGAIALGILFGPIAAIFGFCLGFASAFFSSYSYVNHKNPEIQHVRTRETNSEEIQDWNEYFKQMDQQEQRIEVLREQARKSRALI